MEQNDQAVNNFFQKVNETIEALKKNLSIWKKADKKKVELVDDIIKSEEKEIELLKKYVDEIKVYIVIKGTISAGKSTFINSLLGCQLLPQKNQECTKQVMEITYGDQIKINDQQFQNPTDARKFLEEQQKMKELKIIKVEFPSLFHKQLPPDLQKRIIFVDTPGIRLSKIEDTPYLILDDVIGKNHVIQIWLSNYTTFDSDKEEIFSFLSTQKVDQQNNQNFVEFDLDDPQFLTREIQQKGCTEKLLFLLNKYDERNESEDDQIETIIKEICQKIGDENFIYKISASDALQYRVMTFGDEGSQKLFVSKFFINNGKKKKIYTEEQCFKFCLSQFANKSEDVDDQDYPLVIHQLQQQISFKINNELTGARLTKIIAQDFYLQMILDHNLKTVVQQTDKLKAEIIGFIKIIHDLLTKYENDITKHKEKYNSQIHAILIQSKNNIQDLNFFKKLFKGNNSTLQQLCSQVLEKEEDIRKKIRELNIEYQNKILSEIKHVEDQNGKIQELSITCQRLFNQFSDKQSKCIELNAFSSLQECFYDNLGIELSLPLQTKIGMVSSILGGGVVAGDVSIAGYYAASTLISTVGVAATGFIGAGLLLIAIKKLVVENKFQSVQEVTQKLNQLEDVLQKRITNVCSNYVTNNNQTIQCLRSLFTALAQ